MPNWTDEDGLPVMTAAELNFEYELDAEAAYQAVLDIEYDYYYDEDEYER